jgi:hypothetical protein
MWREGRAAGFGVLFTLFDEDSGAPNRRFSSRSTSSRSARNWICSIPLSSPRLDSSAAARSIRLIAVQPAIVPSASTVALVEPDGLVPPAFVNAGAGFESPSLLPTSALTSRLANAA